GSEGVIGRRGCRGIARDEVNGTAITGVQALPVHGFYGESERGASHEVVGAEDVLEPLIRDRWRYHPGVGDGERARSIAYSDFLVGGTHGRGKAVPTLVTGIEGMVCGELGGGVAASEMDSTRVAGDGIAQGINRLYPHGSWKTDRQ